MTKSLLFLVVMCFVFVDRIESSSVVRLCGRRLISIMNHVCENGVEDFIVSSPLDMLSGRNIFETCCTKPCTYTYLKSFCKRVDSSDSTDNDQETVPKVELESVSDEGLQNFIGPLGLEAEKPKHRHQRRHHQRRHHSRTPTDEVATETTSESQ